MDAIDWILNLACLLLWLNWRSIRFAAVPQSSVLSLVGALERAEARRAPQWSSLAALAAILFLRALFYYQIGPAVNWTPMLELGAVAIPFRSDRFGRILLFSALRFAVWFCGLYSWLLLLSAVNQRTLDTDPWQRLIRLHLGKLERLPMPLKILLPFLAVMLLWIAVHPMLSELRLVPAARTGGQVLRQAALLGISSVLFWKLLLLGILVLHVVNSYVYLGRASLWQFVSSTANHLLRPLRFLSLQIGKMDFAPLLGIVIVIALAELLSVVLPKIYQLL